MQNTVAKPKGLKPGAIQARRAAAAVKRQPPKAVQALAKAGAATFVAGQMARAQVNKLFSRNKGKARSR